MYKIHRLLLFLTLSVPFTLLGQRVPTKLSTVSRALKADPVARNPLTTERRTGQKTVFTVHPLADQVETGKKHEYDV